MTPAKFQATIADEAAAWLARHDRGLLPQEEQAFAAWRAEDKRHAAEFDHLQRQWQDFALAKADPELARMAAALEHQTRANCAARRSPVYYWAFSGLAAAAAAIVLMVSYRGGESRSASVSIASNPAPRQAAPYSVVPRSARTQTLPDGSVADLRDDTEIAFDFNGRDRKVRILHGEAHFRVTKNPDRPFIVIVSRVAVRAVGTAFNVRLGPGAIDVVVTEGRVSVDDVARQQSLLTQPESSPTNPAEPSPVLRAGQSLTVKLSTDGTPANVVLTELSPGEIDRELAWQSTRLIFEDTTLAAAVEAFNRHGKHRIEMDVDVPGQQLIGGSFRTDNVEGFVRTLHLTTDIRSETLPDGSIRLHAGR